MLMCEQMVLTVLIVALTFGAIAELQMVPVLFCPAAYCTFMNSRALWLHLLHIAFKLISAVYLFRRIPSEIPAHQEENDEVQQGHHDRYPVCPASLYDRQENKESIDIALSLIHI